MPPRSKTWQSSNVPKPVDKGKGKIEVINFGEHTDEIQRIWKGLPPAELVEKWKQAGVSISQSQQYYNAGSMFARMSRIRRLVGYNGSNLVGYCSQCKNLNTHLVKYHTQGITLVERYCNLHLPK